MCAKQNAQGMLLATMHRIPAAFTNNVTHMPPPFTALTLAHLHTHAADTVVYMLKCNHCLVATSKASEQAKALHPFRPLMMALPISSVVSQQHNAVDAQL
jgi:hypothetical protein